MVRIIKLTLTSAAFIAAAVAFPTHAAEYGRQKIAQWTDPFTPPQTRTRCVSEAWGKWPWGGEWRTCNGWATDVRTMQVVVYLNPCSPLLNTPSPV